ncbi:MAG: hypothetical protein AB1485_04145 [Candidatus Thermoplasmatota archaeon]
MAKREWWQRSISSIFRDYKRNPKELQEEWGKYRKEFWEDVRKVKNRMFSKK